MALRSPSKRTSGPLVSLPCTLWHDSSRLTWIIPIAGGQAVVFPYSASLQLCSLEGEQHCCAPSSFSAPSIFILKKDMTAYYTGFEASILLPKP